MRGLHEDRHGICRVSYAKENDGATYRFVNNKAILVDILHPTSCIVIFWTNTLYFYTQKRVLRKTYLESFSTKLLVPTEGLEPPHPKTHGPEPCASTNSATWALHQRTRL